MAPAAATQPPNVSDDSRAAPLDGPRFPLFRSNALGGDPRIANFGGGGASSKANVAEAADFLASDAASKSTGAIIDVDADAAVSCTR
jgi:rhamnose utilization protein RhaD (predicted bifunctional aldolase and dehydrogenase)